ncbi:hypothetical protein PHLCEN_2v9536 [Hermanssonia centrifuga]|uniref:Large ribosomal subunit protein uL6 alpha-beta domain-containing protein n=1 Tax=Hermanssonia centrifuga TaxID=98765 RepID=A0A2R6NQI9_9APHY|nr:hypothetical protein PHLCEN_2v9536 [Hermanssonia centrifuga]
MLPRLRQLGAFVRRGISTAGPIPESARIPGNYLSNIGKQYIKLPPSVTVSQSPKAISVAGPLGTTDVPHPPFVKFHYLDPQTLAVTVEKPAVKKQRAIWGLTRTLIANAVTGMSEGFSTPLNFVGVGYRAAMEEDPRGKRPGFTGQRLIMKLGFSHDVYVPVPDHIQCEVVTPTKIMLGCTDKQKMGLFAAQLRSWRKPEPYKGKVSARE